MVVGGPDDRLTLCNIPMMGPKDRICLTAQIVEEGIDCFDLTIGRRNICSPN